MSGFVGAPINKTVKIIPEEKYPFKITGVKAKNGNNFKYTLKEIKESNRQEYLLNLENLKKEKGRYFDTIQLATDSEIKTEIRIKIYGNIIDKQKKGKLHE